MKANSDEWEEPFESLFNHLLGVLGENIKTFRQRRHLKSEDLAALSGVSTVTLSQLENGRKKDVTLSTIAAISKGLGLSEWVLLQAPTK